MPEKTHDSSAEAVTSAARPGARPATIGKYRLGAELGRGGAGVVYQALDPLLGRAVAVKVLAREYAAEPALVERFLRKARAVAALNHPHVVTVHEINQEQDVYYLVMELVAGGSAQGRLRAQGRLPWQDATRIVRDACRGLLAAHRAGLIHRDIKPSNILLSDDGSAKLADFGLARSMSGGDVALTGPGCVVGTPLYMSPEQCRQESLDDRTDLYSLGAAYYTLLTGRPPYDLDGHALYVAHCTRPVPDPREFAADIPEACAAIVRRALAKEPVARHAGAADLLGELDAALSAHAPSGPPGTAGRGGLPAADIPTVLSAAPAPASRRRLGWLVAGGLVLLVAGLLWWQRPDAPPAPLWPPNPCPVRGFVPALHISHDKSHPIMAWGVTDEKEGSGQVVLWDWRSGQLRHEIPVNHSLNSLALSPDGALLATGASSNGAVAVFDTASGQKVDGFPLDQAGLRRLAFGADKRTLWIAVMKWGQPYPAELQLYANVSGSWQARRTLPLAKQGDISGLAVAPDGSVAVVAIEDGRVFLVDQTLKARTIRAAGAGHVYTPAFSADGRLVAGGIWGGGQGVIHVWEVRSGDEVRTLSARKGDVTAVAFAPDSKSLASIGSGFLDFWESPTGRRLGAPIKAGEAPFIRALEVTPDGASVFAGDGNRAFTRYDVLPSQRP